VPNTGGYITSSLKDKGVENRWLTIDCAQGARKVGRFYYRVKPQTIGAAMTLPDQRSFHCVEDLIQRVENRSKLRMNQRIDNKLDVNPSRDSFVCSPIFKLQDELSQPHRKFILWCTDWELWSTPSLRKVDWLLVECH
jgi:hypothetical protein